MSQAKIAQEDGKIIEESIVLNKNIIIKIIYI